MRGERGQPVEFGLVLVGRALDFLPYFVLAFRDLADEGLGLNRARCTLERVEAVPPAAVAPVSDRRSVVGPPVAPFDGAAILSEDVMGLCPPRCMKMQGRGLPRPACDGDVAQKAGASPGPTFSWQRRIPLRVLDALACHSE